MWTEKIEGVEYEGKQYRLRASQPMPTYRRGAFVLHTFMAEVNTIDVVVCTNDLPKSSDFRGQGGDLISANFSRLNVQGGDYFQGKRVHKPEYVDEDAYGFNF
jgi:hypothetical protein